MCGLIIFTKEGVLCSAALKRFLEFDQLLEQATDIFLPSSQQLCGCL